MKYVNIIRRIDNLNKAILRIPLDERYDELYFSIDDKRRQLRDSLRVYIHCPDRTDRELRRRYSAHRKQVKLACQLLGVDYHAITLA